MKKSVQITKKLVAKAVSPQRSDRARTMGKIPKPGRDFVDCCYTSCTRC